jgi:hypothetical protein
MRCIVEALKALHNLSLLIEENIGDDQQQVLVYVDRFYLIDNDGTVETTSHLLVGGHVRVIPVCAGIRQNEFIVKCLSAGHSGLGNPRDTIHGIGQANAMPVDGRRLWELIFEAYLEGLALSPPNQRAWNLVVKAPD